MHTKCSNRRHRYYIFYFLQYFVFFGLPKNYFTVVTLSWKSLFPRSSWRRSLWMIKGARLLNLLSACMCETSWGLKSSLLQMMLSQVLLIWEWLIWMHDGGFVLLLGITAGTFLRIEGTSIVKILRIVRENVLIHGTTIIIASRISGILMRTINWLYLYCQLLYLGR